MNSLRVGTRPSLLATTQTKWFVEKLVQSKPNLQVELVPIKSEGDATTTPLSEAKTPGVFVSSLRSALLENRVDLVVHSMKDLPSAPHPQIITGCTPEREDPRDVLVSKLGLTISQLPAGAVVGTSSPRRAASIRNLRPDLQLRSIRGNVDSRISKVRSGEFDATVLALAGLNRINKSHEVSEFFDPEQMIPAPGQGALAVECRVQDRELFELLDQFTDLETLLTTTAERSVLLGLGASCQTAIGAFATLDNGQLSLVAELAIEDTGESVRLQASLSDSELTPQSCRELGMSIAKRFRAMEIASRAALN